MNNSLATVRPYVRVETDIRARILDGRWTPGRMIPSRKDLAKEYGVALTVIERAISGLLADGTLTARDRRGTFVASALPPGPFIPQAPGVPEDRTSPELAHDEPVADFNTFNRFVNIGVISSFDPANPRQTDDNGSGLKDYWEGIIMNSLERTVTRAGGMCSFYNLYREDGRQVNLLDGVRALIALEIDALAMIKDDQIEGFSELSAILEASKIPIVFIMSANTPPSSYATYHDNKDAGFQAGRHLIHRRHQEITFFSPYTAQWVRDRAAGVVTALEYSGLGQNRFRMEMVDVELSQTSGRHEALAYEFAKIRLADGLPGRGIVCANDHVAHGFLKAAKEAGYRAGGDFAIVGFDDLDQSRMLGLTTMRPPLEGLGREAARILVRSLNGDRGIVQVKINSTLIARASSRPLPLPH